MAKRDFEFELTDEQIEQLEDVDHRSMSEGYYIVLAQIYIPKRLGYEHLERHLCVGKLITGTLAEEARDTVNSILKKQEKKND
jgi:hypothetical protein